MRASRWFSGVGTDLQDRLLAHARWVHLKPGDNLAMAGAETGGLFGVGMGTVYSLSSLAPPDISMSDLHPAPFWFISQTLLPGERQLVSVVAQTPVTCLFLPQHRIFEIMIDHPELRHHLFRHVSELFTGMTTTMSDGLIRDGTARCIAVLLRAAGQRFSGNLCIDVPIAHMDVAGMANLSRQKVGEVLRGLEQQGLVELRYRKIRVLHPDRMRALLEG